MKLLGRYKNGNYMVTIFDDGTKIRENDLDNLTPDTVESMDIKITNMCDMGCPMCHEDSKPDGLHGDILSPSFLDHLHPYTELAIGGGNPLAHPDLVEFLERCKVKKLIPSMTVNQHHFMKDYDLIKKLVDEKLIYGLGISLMNSADKEFIAKVKEFPNAVLHVINGMIKPEDIEALKNQHLKILILGYKEFRRGLANYTKDHNHIEALKNYLYENLKSITEMFDLVSFANLAIKQLDPKRLMSQDKWDEFYMGDDGQYTMYVDMVNKKFAQNSCEPLDKRYDLLDTIEEMFNYLKEH